MYNFRKIGAFSIYYFKHLSKDYLVRTGILLSEIHYLPVENIVLASSIQIIMYTAFNNTLYKYLNKDCFK